MKSLAAQVCRITGATKAVCGERIQSLWSGYGELVKMQLVGVEPSHVVIKHAKPPGQRRSEKVDASHARKLHSYAVELNWYQQFAAACSPVCRVPRNLGCRSEAGSWIFVLEDLDESGFPRRTARPSQLEVQSVLRWLAAFHATFMGRSAQGLWKVGTYWHLATRLDELQRVRDRTLRDAAAKVDARLNACSLRTLVHGDAKVENFCFGNGLRSSVDTMPHEAGNVAAVDFQYVGGGCGMKDIAYFLSSVWDSVDCDSYADDALVFYFQRLHEELAERGSTAKASIVESEWRQLYPFAWADFQRFLGGWAPGCYDDHPYAQRMVNQALSNL